MLNIFKKKHREDFIEFMEGYNFYYMTEYKQFIGFHDDLVFKVGFDTSGYGSRISILFESYMPLLEKNLNIYSEDMPHNHEISLFKWDLVKLKKLSKDEKDILLSEYIEDMKYIVKNYIYCINSSKINGFRQEDYILNFYDAEYGRFLKNNNKEDGASKYRGDFIENGKKLEAYTLADEEKALELGRIQKEEEFPYEIEKQKIMDNIINNRDEYEKIKKKFMIGQLVIDKNIYPVVDGEYFLYKSSYGKLITECLERYGYFHDNKHFFVERDVFRHKDDENCRVKINLDNLFISFTIYVKNTDIQATQTGVNFFKNADCVYEPKEIAFYINTPFSIGWLIGDEATIEKNINLAVLALENNLKTTV